MYNYVLTEKGSSWIASRMVGGSKPLDVMYVIYDNGGKECIDLVPSITADYFHNLSGTTGAVRITKNIANTCIHNESGSTSAMISGIVHKDDLRLNDKYPEVTASVSKIIAVAVGYSGSDTSDSDVIVAACNITKDGVCSPVPWIDNMSMSVSCPITIAPYPSEK